MAAETSTARRVQRILAGTGRGRLTRGWTTAYLAVARLVGRHLGGGAEHATVYLRGSVDSADFVPGISDVDLVILVDDPSAGMAADRRWERLRRRVAPVARLVDRPRVHTVEELGSLLGRSWYTVGLERPKDKTADRSAPDGLDAGRVLDRPGLYATTESWRRLAGRERRPEEPPRSAQQQRIACWLELLFYWKRAFGAVTAPEAPHVAATCVKLVSEPARVLLWLTAGVRPSSRLETFERVAPLLPGAEASLAAITGVERALHRMPPAPLEVALPLLARISSLVAREIEEQIEPAGTTHVRLAGVEGSRPMPLCDWRALVRGADRDERLVLAEGSPGDVGALRRTLGLPSVGDRAGLAGDGIVVLPSIRRIGMRGVSCRATDPVTFALLDGAGSAGFPDVEGWSADAWSRRAVAEHRARLAAGAAEPGLHDLAAAARAALFRESVVEGEPLLPLTHEAALALLADGRGRAAGVEQALEALREGIEPPPGTLAALRSAVERLPALSGPLPAGRAG